MLSSIIQYATSRPKRVIAIWLVVGIGLSLLGSFKAYSVTTDDTAQFLPKGSESAQALRYAREAFGAQKGTTTMSVLVRRADGGPLSAADRAGVARLADGLPRWRPDLDPLVDTADGVDLDIRERAGGVVAAAAGPVARDGRFQLVAVQWKANTTDPVAQDAFRQFRDRVTAQAQGAHLTAGFTGGIASAADLTKATEGTQMLSQLLLFGAVLLLSLLFFRGPLAAIVPLMAIVVVGGAAAGLVVGAALLFGFKLDQSTPQLITVVLVGIGIDYFMFLLFRVRERLRAGDGRRAAATAAAGRVGPVIASAALVVVAAFATLGIARFGQFRVLGPSIAISVLVMLLAGVTLMPAIAATTGRALFWPSRSWEREDGPAGPAARLGAAIAHRPGRAALVVTAALVALSTAALGVKMDYDLSSSGPATAATRTADAISASLPEGAGDPQQVYVRSSRGPLTPAALAPLRRRLAAVDGVGSVAAPVLTADRRGARIDVALDAESTSAAGMAVARGPLRRVAHAAAPAGSTALVAGNAAVFADVSDAVGHDLRLVFPIAAVLILLILVVTLRSAIAPLYLLAAVALEFAATLGAAVLVFQVLGGTGGVAFTLPLVLFLFVVALGTDYNILMTARLREELLGGKPVREAVADAVRHVAPAIAAAGLVLASSFGTLMLEADEGARQMGFAMAAGILIAALVVSSVLVPAITALVGHRAFRRGARPAPAPEGTRTADRRVAL
jgi:putative drug exporter of the RND superfamily